MKVKCSQTPDEVSFPINIESKLTTSYPGDHQRSWDRGGRKGTREPSGWRWKNLFHLTGPHLLTQRMEPSQTRLNSYPVAPGTEREQNCKARCGLQQIRQAHTGCTFLLSFNVCPVSLPHSPREGWHPSPSQIPCSPYHFLV